MNPILKLLFYILLIIESFILISTLDKSLTFGGRLFVPTIVLRLLVIIPLAFDLNAPIVSFFKPYNWSRIARWLGLIIIIVYSIILIDYISYFNQSSTGLLGTFPVALTITIILYGIYAFRTHRRLQ